MTTQWTSNVAPPGNGNLLGISKEEMETRTGVLLLYGKNSFGDKIYSYLEITIPNLRRLKEAALKGEPFTPSDFGTVIAAGRGEPTDEVRAEIAALHQVFDGRTVVPKPAAAPIPAAKKAWDEY